MATKRKVGGWKRDEARSTRWPTPEFGVCAEMLERAVEAARYKCSDEELAQLEAEHRATQARGKKHGREYRRWKYARDQTREAKQARRWLAGAPAILPAEFCCQVVGWDFDWFRSKLRADGTIPAHYPQP